MRGHGIVACLCALLSMGLLVIIMCQHQVLILMSKDINKLPMEIKRLDDQISELDTMEVSVEKLLILGEKIGTELKATEARLGPEMEKTRTEIDTCRGERKRAADELAIKEKEHTEAEAILKPESDAWKQEINNLLGQAVEYRPICDHLKDNPKAMKLCGTKGDRILGMLNSKLT